jgi:hypothetical protein
MLIIPYLVLYASMSWAPQELIGSLYIVEE